MTVMPQGHHHLGKSCDRGCRMYHCDTGPGITGEDVSSTYSPNLANVLWSHHTWEAGRPWRNLDMYAHRLAMSGESERQRMLQ